MMLGPYTAYIVPAYAISALVIAGLFIRTWLDHRRRLAELAKLEGQGIGRRGTRKSSDG